MGVSLSNMQSARKPGRCFQTDLSDLAERQAVSPFPPGCVAEEGKRVGGSCSGEAEAGSQGTSPGLGPGSVVGFRSEGLRSDPASAKLLIVRLLASPGLVCASVFSRAEWEQEDLPGEDRKSVV